MLLTLLRCKTPSGRISLVNKLARKRDFLTSFPILLFRSSLSISIIFLNYFVTLYIFDLLQRMGKKFRLTGSFYFQPRVLSSLAIFDPRSQRRAKNENARLSKNFRSHLTKARNKREKCASLIQRKYKERTMTSPLFFSRHLLPSATRPA